MGDKEKVLEDRIYEVWHREPWEDGEDWFITWATGNPSDIVDFYWPEHGNRTSVRLVKPLYVSPEAAQEVRDLQSIINKGGLVEDSRAAPSQETDAHVIYAVYPRRRRKEWQEGNEYLLYYATGDPLDILNYFSPEGGSSVEEIIPVHISHEMAKKAKERDAAVLEAERKLKERKFRPD